MKKALFILGNFLALAHANLSYAASYDTLPAGIDAFIVKQVMTTTIDSKFDSNNNAETFALKEDFNSSKLENVSSALSTYFQELKAISPEAYNQFSLGEFKAEASAKVTAQGLGLARGMTDHFTIYGSLPIYHIKTNVTFEQSQKSNLAAVQTALKNASTSSATSSFVKQLTLQIPETNEELLQSLIVNYYGYKALGAWEKDALGDAEVGGIYRLTDFSDRGLAIAGGFVFPTGDADDPDSLQDVSTGDGQFDAFVESMAGISFLDDSLQLDLKTRYTYQFSSKKILRATDDPNFPLSRSKELIREKLGNKLDTTLTATVNVNTWFNINTSFIYNETAAATYYASNPSIKSTLEKNTYSSNQWARLGIGFSSVELYKTKKMDIPFEVNLSGQKLLNAKNSANYQRFDFDVRLYF